MFELHGRTALVTGAAGARVGTGEGIARQLVRAGARVVVADVNAVELEAAATRLRSLGGSVTVSVFDVTVPEQVSAGVRAAEAEAGPIDIVVNCAGGGPVGQFRTMNPTTWARAIDLNVFGTANVTRAVIDGMCERGWGRVVNIASVAGVHGLAMGLTSYGAAKAAVMGFTRHLAMEVGRDGVTVNAIAPGGVDREARRSERPVPGTLDDPMPTGRGGVPDDIGSMCVYLASEEAAWVTGQVMHVNGGSYTC